MSEAPSVRRRKMLSHPATPSPRPGSSQGTAIRTRSQYPSFDAMSIALALLLAVGLISLALAVWLLYALPRQIEAAPGAGPGERAALRLVHVEQTRDAQQATISLLQNELESTRRELATVTAASDLPAALPMDREASTVLDRAPLALILDAPVYQQQHSLSCESSAAAMAANYFGVSISEEAILAALPRHDNPHHGFRGNVDGSYGGIVDYGVYAGPVRQVLTSRGLQAELLVGGIDEIRAHLRQGRVIIAWITFNLEAQTPTQVTTSDGQVVTVVPYQHVVLVTGYNRDGLWVNDPYSGIQTFYPEYDFVRSFSYLGNMALVVGPPVGS